MKKDKYTLVVQTVNHCYDVDTYATLDDTNEQIEYHGSTIYRAFGVEPSIPRVIVDDDGVWCLVYDGVIIYRENRDLRKHERARCLIESALQWIEDVCQEELWKSPDTKRWLDQLTEILEMAIEKECQKYYERFCLRYGKEAVDEETNGWTVTNDVLNQLMVVDIDCINNRVLLVDDCVTEWVKPEDMVAEALEWVSGYMAHVEDDI